MRSTTRGSARRPISTRARWLRCLTARMTKNADLRVKVWYRLVRVAHWSLAACVLAAWATAELKLKSAEQLHEWLGYAALAVIALRVAWGWIGPRYARFGHFVAGPART